MKTLLAVALVIAAAAVFVFWEKRDNGRYVYNSDSYMLLDTRTGTIFAGSGHDANDPRQAGMWFEIHPQTATYVLHPMKK